MQRMWMVDPTILCDEHLQREHWEIHQLADVCQGSWDIKPLTAVKKVVGHAARGQVFPQYITARHNRLANHIDERGIGHDSPLSYSCPIEYDVTLTDAVIDQNRRDLSRRCEKCADRIDNLISP